MDEVEFIKACKNGDIEAVKKIIDGKNLNYRGNFGRSPLINAVIHNQKDIVDLLHDVNHNLVASDGDTALNKSLYIENIEITKVLLEKSDVNLKANNGNTPLLIAVTRLGHPQYYELIELLINNNADVNSQNDKGETTLELAARYGCIDVVKLLIQRGAHIDHQNKEGVTPLIQAAKEKHKDIVEYLVKNNANVNLYDKYLWSALIFSASECLETTRLLLKYGAHIDHQNHEGDTALIKAAYWNQINIVEHLISCGANVDIKNNFGETAFDKSEDYCCIQVLLNSESINYRDEFGDTFLHKSIRDCKDEDVNFLIDRGADMLMGNNNGETPYHILMNHENLTPPLQALKEKIILDKEIKDTDDMSHSL